jgi:hypothetical protein
MEVFKVGHPAKGTEQYSRELAKSREWKANHKEHVRSEFRKWKAANKHKVKEYRDKAPWANHCYGAKTRCSSKSHSYFKKGIKFLMEMSDFKTLWFRDKAFTMVMPSIDRIDPNGNYELGNCRFIELDDNRRRAVKVKRYDCSVSGCQSKKYHAKGLCKYHYHKSWKDGQS